MCQIGLLGLQLRDEVESLGQAVVREVFFFAQGVQHQHLQSTQLLHLLGGNGIGVGDIGHRADAEAQHRQVLVHHIHRRDRHRVRDTELILHHMQVGLRETRVAVRLKDIVIVTTYGMLGLGVEVDIHLAALHIVERPYVVQPTYMVAVRMGDEDGVQMVHTVAQHLLPEVGTDVDENIS